MMYYTYVFPFGDNSYNIEQEYEPIYIKWDTGYMYVCPPSLFEIGNMRNCINNFNKMVKMSVWSDKWFDTTALVEWRRAIHSEFKFLDRVDATINDAYTTICDEIQSMPYNTQKTKQSELKHLRKKYSAERKKLESRRKRVQKCAELLADILKINMNVKE